MAFKRGPDGKIIETPTQPPSEPTRRLERRPVGGGETPPRLGVPDNAARSRVLPANPDADTESVGEQRAGRPVATHSADAERTRLVGPVGRRRETAGAEMSEDPVVGWLVVIDGPGRGQARAVGYGMNSIGRGPTERISLEFGDAQMSRSSHAVLTYDPRSRKFYLQHGGGRNLTYIGDQAVLTPTEIASGTDILIGATRLRFIALCGPEFDWQDTQDT
ncbi:MAG: FHA domain-containing protein [Reyranellaceae bacterium]